MIYNAQKLDLWTSFLALSQWNENLKGDDRLNPPISGYVKGSS